MAKKLYDLAVKTGEYTNGSGETKGRYLNVGAVMQNDEGGKFIFLNKTFNPAGVPDLSGRGGESVILSMFAPKDKDQAAAPAQAAPANGLPANPDDDVPF